MPPTSTDFDFSSLERLRETLRGFHQIAETSLRNYYDERSGGFFHVLDPDVSDDDPQTGNEPGDFSKASTATAVAFLVDTGRWKPDSDWADKTGTLADEILQLEGRNEWHSAGLDPGNPFTSSFMLEALYHLKQAGATFTDEQLSQIRDRLEVLQEQIIKTEDEPRTAGGVQIENHPTNAYLTQLALRVLTAWDSAEPVYNSVSHWAAQTIAREIAVATTIPAKADYFQIGYAAIILSILPGEYTRQIDKELVRQGLKMLFDAQRDDGGWPLGNPLFHYPAYGNAYCFSFEFLAQLLSVRSLWPQLGDYVPHFKRAVEHLQRVAFPLPHGGRGWSSQHHPQLHLPESWSTASVYHFFHKLDRLLATRAVEELRDYVATGEPAPEMPTYDVLDDLLPMPLYHGDQHLDLRGVVRTHLIDPILEEDEKLRSGKSIETADALSIILFGPPGTAKTTLAEGIARALGWSLVSVNPSHLLRQGLEGVHPELRRLFRMLRHAERIVVLFDEFDELVRSRREGEFTQRFLTTAMLPRIAELRDLAKLVFIIATNHLEAFDAAVRRPGRIDMILPVMPPDWDAKKEEWPEVSERFEALDFRADTRPNVETWLNELTYDEFAGVAEQLAGAEDESEFRETLESARDSGILAEEVNDGKTWKEIMSQQQPKVRIPGTLS